jgi:hypothetical protein
VIRSTAAEALLARADACRRELLGRKQDACELGHRRRLDAVDLGHDPVEREQLGVRDQRLAQTAHAARRRLHREDNPALEVLLRSLQLGLPDVAGGDVGDLLCDDREARLEVLGARADVDTELARVRVLAGERETEYAIPASRIS